LERLLAIDAAAERAVASSGVAGDTSGVLDAAGVPGIRFFRAPSHDRPRTTTPSLSHTLGEKVAATTT